jgi:hypothetical protein
MSADKRRVYSIDASRKPKGYQQITSLSSAVGLTVPSFARIAVIQAEAQIVRWRDDSVDPSSTVGMPLAVGASMVYAGNLSTVKFIQAASGAILNVTYYD